MIPDTNGMVAEALAAAFGTCHRHLSIRRWLTQHVICIWQAIWHAMSMGRLITEAHAVACGARHRYRIWLAQHAVRIRQNIRQVIAMVSIVAEAHAVARSAHCGRHFIWTWLAAHVICMWDVLQMLSMGPVPHAAAVGAL